MENSLTLEQAADALGRDNGRGAGEWWAEDTLAGRSDLGKSVSAASLLKKLEKNDADVVDSLPVPQLSGEWADEPSGPDIYNAIYAMAEKTPDELQDDFTELLDRYEQAFQESVYAAVQGRLRKEVA